jgi:hypothetical protein
MAEQPEPDPDGQRVVRVAGARRARLTPVPGSDPAPESGPETHDDDVAAGPRGPKGPNDDRLMQDVPPHY